MEKVLTSIARALRLHVEQPNSLARYRTDGDNLFCQLSLQQWVLELQSRLCPELRTEFEKPALELAIAGIPNISSMRAVVTRDQEWLLFSRVMDLFELLGFGHPPHECLSRIASIQRSKVLFDETAFGRSLSVLVSHLDEPHKTYENWFQITCEIDEVHAAFVSRHRKCDPLFTQVAPEKSINRVIGSVRAGWVLCRESFF